MPCQFRSTSSFVHRNATFGHFLSSGLRPNNEVNACFHPTKVPNKKGVLLKSSGLFHVHNFSTTSDAAVVLSSWTFWRLSTTSCLASVRPSVRRRPPTLASGRYPRCIRSQYGMSLLWPLSVRPKLKNPSPPLAFGLPGIRASYSAVSIRTPRPNGGAIGIRSGRCLTNPKPKADTTHQRLRVAIV